MREHRDPPVTGTAQPGEPASFLAASAALDAIDTALRTAQNPSPPGPRHTPTTPGADPEQALAALLLLRELRARLATWESPLVENARAAGATWADLAHPMGVASRQAAENRYLRLRPATDDASTGAQRVKDVRDRRAADRAITAWARDNATDLRILAAQITAVTDLPTTARPHQARLRTALGHHDAARLLAPLADIRPHLDAGHHPDIAARLDTLTKHTDQLRHDSNHDRT
ncbi:type III effector protein [Kitasatospora sp. NBC_00240]|uniref:type III effector protein n=1 Tax=Kitasatospora sp. NBC_00240 TaxID=2903567 RepID=UPI00225BA2CC|nr:type III effector protein [Kitasatospora sp. NBC_00240]MCX5215317.1 type III effector protein [Kitasatospora sp. NBC_00240]